MRCPVYADLTKEWATEYEILYETAEINPEKHPYINWYTNKILLNKSRYQFVEARTKVPWFVVAAIHMLEANGDFTKHLHNGDSLLDRTRHYPAGRPKSHEPPFTWEESAADALAYEGVKSVKVWDIAQTLWFLEKYNGLGSKTGAGQATTPPRRSPYLWSFTQHYVRGKYTDDGKFDPMIVSEQGGACAIFKGLEARKLMKPLCRKSDFSDLLDDTKKSDVSVPTEPTKPITPSGAEIASPKVQPTVPSPSSPTEQPDWKAPLKTTVAIGTLLATGLSVASFFVPALAPVAAVIKSIVAAISALIGG
jgi:lysozyme family protein